MASWAQRTLDQTTSNMRKLKAKLAAVCHNCAPDAVEAFVGDMLSKPWNDCPSCGYDHGVLHRSDCTFKAMLDSRKAT